MADIEIGDYTANISENFVATVYYRGEEVWQSRAFRIRDQAVRIAEEYIEKATGEAKMGDITLDVQNLSVDADTLLGGL